MIRSISERTSEVCQKIVEAQVPIENVYIINEKPFSEAVKKTLEIGAKHGKWLIAVDADVLLFSDSIAQMVERAESFNQDFFFYQGAVLDKFFLGYRPAGPHLYNCRHLTRSLELRKGFENDMRPESYIRSRMVEKGYAYIQDKTVYGLHNFEQSYIDFYKKTHRAFFKDEYFMKKLLRLFKKFNKADLDFAIAEKSILDTLEYKIQKPLHEDELNVMAMKAMGTLNLEEKSKLPVTTVGEGDFSLGLKEQFLEVLDMDENFLAKQRYFPRLNTGISRLFKKLLFKP